jgi:HD-GYP domain-containing protein (c-di-GMP phosphodiesterase class II)
VSSSKKQAEIEAQLAAQLMDLDDDDEPALTKSELFGQEINRAAKIKEQARRVVGDVLGDARAGRPIDVAPVGDVVQDIIASIQRNPDAILSLCMLKKKDDYTFMHSVNVGVLLIAFCCSLEMDKKELADIGMGGMLFDIGKMRISNRILSKPGPLTKEEFSEARRHVELGKRLLERTPGITQESIQIASLHHERLDGSGYPYGLKGDEISDIGQMAAIVDVYDAITSTSSYRQGIDPNLVLKKMMRWRGTLFDNHLLQQFVHFVGIYPMGSLVQLENGLIGVVIRPNPGSLLHPVINIIIDSKEKKYLKPQEMDLLIYKNDKKSGYKIKKLESAADWKVDPRKFMPMPENFL